MECERTQEAVVCHTVSAQTQEAAVECHTVSAQTQEAAVECRMLRAWPWAAVACHTARRHTVLMCSHMMWARRLAACFH